MEAGWLRKFLEHSTRVLAELLLPRALRAPRRPFSPTCKNSHDFSWNPLSTAGLVQLGLALAEA